MQTPQTFRVDVIRRAMTKVRESGLQVTDDTAACEWIGPARKTGRRHRAKPQSNRARRMCLTWRCC